MQRIILHLDMNSYFASVEQQANPFLRGQPVGVCAYLSKNGCIVASSIEAKKLGIKTGCSVREAKQIYPDIFLVENDPNKYRTVTNKLFKILKSYSSAFEPYSIDEGFLDLTGFVKNFDQAVSLAEEIRQRIKNEVGEWLKCSIGLSFTKFLAKFASDTADKGGIKIIADKEQLTMALAACQLTDLWGIGRAIEKRLNALGIDSPLALKNHPVENLSLALGKQGYFLWAHVNGLEVDHLKVDEELISKSIGHSYCLPIHGQDKEYLNRVFSKLCFKVGYKLRQRKQEAYGFYIYWSYLSGGGFGKRFKLNRSLSTNDDLFDKAKEILDQTELSDKVRMLAVGVFDLRAISGQLALFASQLEVKQKQLAEQLDKINDQFGDQVIYRGSMWQTEKLAKKRIGFRKVDLG